MDLRKNLPLYMGYPQYQNWNQIDENKVLEDLEYLQQIYPTYAKSYQSVINDYLDRMDYEGSMIYDQYPDKWQLDRMVKNIVVSINLEDKDKNNEQHLPWIKELVTVLLYCEILKRRRKKSSYRYF